MTVADKAPYDTGTDIRRLLDAGYQVTFQLWDLADRRVEYYANVTSEYGSRWKGLGATPGEALRSVWPLGDAPGAGGCGHCGRLGCDVVGCATCAAYTDSPGDGVCGVCGAGHHWRLANGGQIEIYDADHAPAVAWRDGAQ